MARNPMRTVPSRRRLEAALQQASKMPALWAALLTLWLLCVPILALRTDQDMAQPAGSDCALGLCGVVAVLAVVALSSACHCSRVPTAGAWTVSR